MKKTIILALFIFTLTGCGTKISTQQPQENSSQSSDEISQKEFIFKKNQDCLKYKDEIEAKLKSKDSPFGETSLEQIFYSPKANSCLYVEYSNLDESYNRRLFDIRDDGPSSHPLEACLLVKLAYDCDELDKKLEEYKSF